MALPNAADPVADARLVLRRCILALMGASHVSQTDLAHVIGIGQGQLSKRLKGDSIAFNEDELAKIANYFGVEIPDLFQPEKVLLRSRCVSLVPDHFDPQLEFSFLPEAQLTAV